jgi:hypothetical protein
VARAQSLVAPSAIPLTPNVYAYPDLGTAPERFCDAHNGNVLGLLVILQFWDLDGDGSVSIDAEGEVVP